LWRLEVANALQMALRRKRIDAAFRDSALAHLSRLSITTDPDTDAYAWTVALQLADRFQLTLYAGGGNGAARSGAFTNTHSIAYRCLEH
jgi:hypothetical protein